jgi:hypothetical protein
VWVVERAGGGTLTRPIADLLAANYERVAEREWENEYTVVEYRRRE